VSDIKTHPRAWLILALILGAEIMDLLDSTMVNVAAPSIARDLNSSTSALQWITGGYALTFAVFLIAGARLGDRFGRRTLFVTGAWGFVICSALCAFAPSTSVLLSGQLLQGAAAAVYFSTVSGHPDGGGHPGYVTGFERAVQVGIGIAVVVFLLTLLLPTHAREMEAATVS
jgi:MFS family permease